MVLTPQNVGAKGVPYFIPIRDPPAGTAVTREDGTLPKLFTPLKIRGVTLPNRIWVSPMCQYSAKDGFVGPWHSVHYGSLTTRGPGLTMLEATAVADVGRITPNDLGIWLDAHVKGLREIVDFAHSQSELIAIQLGHAGRKASTAAPWLGPGISEEAQGGWPEQVVGPDDRSFSDSPDDVLVPHALTLAEIARVRRDFVAGAKRAVQAGFDVVELHFAHGYLVSSFLSPATNQRADQYGGSFENRARLALEIAEDVRAVLPESMPLFVRISATDWLHNNPDYHGPAGWTVEESARLAGLLADRGVDVLDVSSGGIHSAQKITATPAFQVPLARHIKKAVGDRLLVSAVGIIRSATAAEEILAGSGSSSKDENGDEEPPLDLIAVGRPFLKNPGLVWDWSSELDTEIRLASQYGWGFGGRSRYASKSF